MSAQHDGQYDMAVVSQSIALVQASAGAGYYVAGAAIDTQGLDYIAVTVEPSRAITATDNIRFTPLECDTSGGTYTAIADDHLLPEYAQLTGGPKVIEPTSPYTQVFGISPGCKRYIQIRFNGIVIDTSNVTLECKFVARSHIKPFSAAYPAFPSDSKA